MRNIFILIGIVIAILVLSAYISLFTDFALPEQGCGSHLSNIPHSSRTCLPPFTCRMLGPDISDGICGL